MPSFSRVLSIAFTTAAFASTDCARLVRLPGTVPEPAPPGLLTVARQLIVVSTADWYATTGTLHRFSRDDGNSEWRPVGAANKVVVGRAGIAWADESFASASSQPIKHEGDGRSPAGVFPLDTAFGFARVADAAWLRVPYVSLQEGSDCVDDDASAHYNTVVDRAAVPRIDWNSAEHMRQISVYRLGVIVGYNAPPMRGRGSCIFLHIWGGPSSVTAGCTALEASELETLMRWLDRTRRPVLVQLTAGDYTRLAAAWRLPVGQ